MFFSKRVLAFLATIMVMMVSCSGNRSTETAVAPTEALATEAIIPTVAATATSIPAIFPPLPEVGINAAGTIDVTWGTAAWPDKVLVTTSGAYVLLSCEGREAVQAFASLSPTTDRESFDLLAMPSCMAGILLIVSGNEVTAKPSFGKNGMTSLGEFTHQSVITITAIKFVAGENGLGGVTEVTVTLYPKSTQ